MTNREKYAEQIIDMTLDSIEIAVDKNGRLCDCSKIICSECMFGGHKGCGEKLKEWSEQEYVEPAVDWSKVPVDAKILVKNDKKGHWEKRHFAKYENGTVYAWNAGQTSYTCGMIDFPAVWLYAKLAEEDV